MAPRRLKTSTLVAHSLAQRAAQLNTGDKLPPESVLTEEFGVGRSTLREALRILELQGVVTIKAGPGGGPVIAAPDHRPLADTLALALQAGDVTFAEVIHARQVIEAALAAMAAGAATEEDLQELRDSLARMEENIHDEDLFLEENLRFHEVCAEAAHDRVLALFHASLKDISDGHIVGISYSVRRRNYVLSMHREIVERIVEHDPEGAREVMSRHIAEFEEYMEKHYPAMLTRSIRWLLDQPGRN